MNFDAEWRTRAACLDGDPDAWFPEKGESATEARRICFEVCPVRGECLDYALHNNEVFGIWGGTTYKQRVVLRRRLGIVDRKPSSRVWCGTTAAYRRHINAGEEPCVSCREANAAYRRARRAA